MRAFLASSIGVTCAAALLVPLANSATLAGTPSAPAHSGVTGPAGAPNPSGVTGASGGAHVDARKAGAQVPGHTQSLPLRELSSGPRSGTGQFAAAEDDTAGAVELGPRAVRPFSLVGLVWDEADSQLRGRVQVRTHAANGEGWSRWRELETHTEDGPDAGEAARANSEARGSTAPLWAGNSDGVQARVLPEGTLPTGLRLELVDPGPDPAAKGAAPSGSGARDAKPSVRKQRDVLPPLSKEETLGVYGSQDWSHPAGDKGAKAENARTEAQPKSAPRSVPDGLLAGHIGPRPGIVTRHGWGANEQWRERGFLYTRSVRTAFVHHTAMSNNYRCSEVPRILRSIYRYHVKSSKWRDIGYNFLVDKCGTIYEGRAGGVAKPVKGAHTYGFNSNSMGVAVLGSFANSRPPAASVNAVAKLTAWKLGLFGVNPRGTAWMTSGGGTKYSKGKKVRLHTISGHRDGYATSCPGAQLYRKLGSARFIAARLQGR